MPQSNILCPYIVTSCPLGKVTLGGKGPHCGHLEFKCFSLFVQIPSESGNV